MKKIRTFLRYVWRKNWHHGTDRPSFRQWFTWRISIKTAWEWACIIHDDDYIDRMVEDGVIDDISDII